MMTTTMMMINGEMPGDKVTAVADSNGAARIDG